MCCKAKDTSFLLLAVCLIGAPVNADEAGVLRFWHNEGDVSNGLLDGIEDRENFFPMLLDIGQFVNAWRGNGVSFRLRGNGAMNIAYTTMNRNDVWALYRSDEVLAGEAFDQPLDSAPVVQVTPAGVTIPDGVLSRIQGGNDVVLACEVRPGARVGIVQFEAVSGDNVLFRFPMGCYASSVTNMYHWINLRHLSGQSETDATMTLPPPNADWSEDLPHVFFVHGANVNETESRIWCEKMFKRLYLSGAKMRFHGVSWRSQVGGKSEYHLNASNSFEVASALATNVNSCTGRKIVMAHSLGTMLTANAIQFFGMQVDKVVFLNSAIPSEAIDPMQFNASTTNRLVHDAWTEYPSNCWTSLYHELGAGTDRGKLTWKNRFPLVAPKLFNMYSSGDEVLNLYSGNGNPGWSDGVWSSSDLGARYSWHKQELWKGRAAWYAAVGTTEWSGWGFKTGIFGGRVWSADDANAVTDPFVFATNTVFNPFPVSITNAVLSEAQISAHLTQGIPALSRALGNVEVDKVLADSYDMNDKRNVERPNGWPNNYSDFGTDWLHSDIKDIPYYYTYPKFDKIVDQGGLR